MEVTYLFQAVQSKYLILNITFSNYKVEGCACKKDTLPDFFSFFFHFFSIFVLYFAVNTTFVCVYTQMCEKCGARLSLGF